MRAVVKRAYENRLEGLGIEMSSRCDYWCVGCPNRSLIRGHGDMDPQLFMNLFQQVGNMVCRVFLWNYGDPLLNPGISRMLEEIEGYKCEKVMSTSGYRLKDFDDLSFLATLDELIVSINGVSEDVYALHQKGGGLAKVTRGLSKLRKALQGKKTKLTMQFVAHKGNIHEIEYLKTFAERFGFDYVVVKSFNVMDNKKETFDKFVPLGTEYSRYQEDGDVRAGIRKRKAFPCMKGFVINWDGSVNACCWDYQGRNVLGRVPMQGVYEIWQSAKARAVRKRVAVGNWFPFCKGDCTVKGSVHRWKI